MVAWGVIPRFTTRAVGPAGGSLGRLPSVALAKEGKPQVHGAKTDNPSPGGAAEVFPRMRRSARLTGRFSNLPAAPAHAPAK